MISMPSRASSTRLIRSSSTARTLQAIRGPQLGADATVLRSHYRVGAGQFTVILVGKDGGEKYRAERVVDPDELFALIDTMPMRRREMRKKPAGG